MKKCSICRIDQTLDNYWKSKTSYDGLQYACKHCQSKSNKKYKDKNKDRTKANRRKSLLKSYGLTPESYDIMFKEQLGLCKICKNPSPKRWRSEKLFVDHDHKSGKVRGLLCHDCNYGLGGFKDNVELLKNAIKYIKGE